MFFYGLLSALVIHLVQTHEGPMQAVSFSVNFYICQSSYFSNALFNCCPTSPLALFLFLSSVSQFSPLSPDLKDLRETFGLELSVSRCIILCISGCAFLYLLPYPLGRNLSHDD